MEQWLHENWFELASTVLGLGGLWFTAFTIRKDTKVRKEEVEARRVANLLAITANHREVWKVFLNDIEHLKRVRDIAADTKTQPITETERMFVTLVILHVNSVYYAMSDRLVVEYEGLRRDISDFFSLPIPKAVWLSAKPLQNHDFAAFIESALK
jgi:hypothetical protein